MAAYGTHTVYDNLGRATSTKRVSGLWVEMDREDADHPWETRVESGHTSVVVSSSETYYTDEGRVDYTVDDDGTQTEYTCDRSAVRSKPAISRKTKTASSNGSHSHGLRLARSGVPRVRSVYFARDGLMPAGRGRRRLTIPWAAPSRRSVSKGWSSTSPTRLTRRGRQPASHGPPRPFTTISAR